MGRMIVTANAAAQWGAATSGPKMPMIDAAVIKPSVVMLKKRIICLGSLIRLPNVNDACPMYCNAIAIKKRDGVSEWLCKPQCH